MWLTEREAALMQAGLRNLQEQLINNGIGGLAPSVLALLDSVNFADDAVVAIDDLCRKVSDLD